jgi:hypothetical protein
MKGGVKAPHAAQDRIAQGAGRREGRVDHDQGKQQTARPGHCALALPQIRPKHLHPPHVQEGKKGHSREDEAYPSQPLEQGPPNENPRRGLVEVGDDGGTGGGDAACGLKQGIHGREREAGQGERQRAESSDGGPGQGNEEEGLPDGKGQAAPGVGDGQGTPAKPGQARARGEDLPVRVARGRVRKCRYGHAAR